MASLLSLAVPLWLAFAPPENDYARTRSQLDATIEGIGQVSTENSIAALEQVMTALTEHPAELSTDLETLEKLDHARMSLVWLHLAQGDAEAATLAMDAAIRATRGYLRSTSNFGPMVRELHDERRAALDEQGTAIIEVDCRIPCQVIVDERRSANPTEPLHLGNHRVWVSARDGSVAWQLFEVDLQTAAETEVLVYSTKVELREVEGVFAEAAVDDRPKAKRLLPRWAEILGVSLGAGLFVGGAVLLALDGKCIGGSECSVRWENTARGAAILSVGGGLLLVSGALLSVDEVRVRGIKTRQVMLTWTLRF
jgi:hypothetical protein